ncbi:MAG: hypothetical protein DWH73_03455 [Planctomycetota bacterium]|nr:MAG: hypothetical protein DWH73_03455 [Planctomycetota bacterium]
MGPLDWSGTAADVNLPESVPKSHSALIHDRFVLHQIKKIFRSGVFINPAFGFPNSREIDFFRSSLINTLINLPPPYTLKLTPGDSHP